MHSCLFSGTLSVGRTPRHKQGELVSRRSNKQTQIRVLRPHCYYPRFPDALVYFPKISSGSETFATRKSDSSYLTADYIPPIKVGLDNILHPANISLDIGVHSFAPGRQLGQGEVPIAITRYEHATNVVERHLCGHPRLPTNGNHVMCYAFLLGMRKQGVLS